MVENDHFITFKMASIKQMQQKSNYVVPMNTQHRHEMKFGGGGIIQTFNHPFIYVKCIDKRTARIHNYGH